MKDGAPLGDDLDRIAGKGGGDSFEALVGRVVREVAAALSVNEDEVAIFLPTQDGSFRFGAPLPLYRDGSSFPAKGSLTQKVFQDAAPLVNNNVKVTKPLSIYERAKISERHPRPIQKMLAVALRDGGAAVGVLQVSRRGLAVREAGPDFGEAEAAKLGALARTVAPFLRRVLPRDHGAA